MHKGWGRVGGCSLCDLAVRTLEAVDGKTDEISYRFPIVNARKLSPSFLSLSLSLSQPRIGLSLSLLFYPPLYGIFFRDRECTRVNEQLSKKERKKKKEEKIGKEKKTENRVRLFYTSVASSKRYFYFHFVLHLPSPLPLSSASGKLPFLSSSLDVVVRKEFPQCVRYSSGSIFRDEMG